MIYNDLIPTEKINEASAKVIRRYRADASDQDCEDLTSAFLILAKYLDNFFTGEYYKELDCTETEFNILSTIATSYRDTFEAWGELIGLGEFMKLRRNVRLCYDFSVICTGIANALNNKAASASREPIKVLSIDIETYSSNDLLSGGVYKYVDAEDFTVLLFAFACDDRPVQIIDLTSGEEIPNYILEALTDPKVLKTAFNANFERVCINRHLGINLHIDQWECTMARSAMLGLPLSLEQVGKQLNLEDQKMKEGKALIRFFSLPCKATKTNGGRTRNLPEHAPDKWEVFKQYCVRDVEVERSIRNKIKNAPITATERQLYILDQRINDRGILLAMDLVYNAVQLDNVYKGLLNAEAAKLTGLDNPNSVAQLRGWLEEQTGEKVDSLRKADIPGLIDGTDDAIVERLLQIRQEMAKTSTKKYEAMVKAACADNRVRGLLQYYGANRTGRWAGRLVQVQNLPQNHLPDLDLARQIVMRGDLEELEMLYGNVPDTLSQLIRTAFIAKPDHTFIVCDFSAIEARVIAWLANETWRLDVFKTHGKIYEASAAMMFHCAVEDITKTDPRRQKGKIAELALGYQGGVGAMKTMGGERMGLSEVEMKEIVDAWRAKNKAIVKLWDDVQLAAMTCIEAKEPIKLPRGITFCMKFGALMVGLPSGRYLSYPRPHIGENRFGGKSICYEGLDQTTKRWMKMETYGGKLVENIVQAIARDCLGETIIRVEAAGYPIVFHVHDEVVIEARTDGSQSLEEVEAIFKTPIPWAHDMPLKGAGYVTSYYLKD